MLWLKERRESRETRFSFVRKKERGVLENLKGVLCQSKRSLAGGGRGCSRRLSLPGSPSARSLHRESYLSSIVGEVGYVLEEEPGKATSRQKSEFCTWNPARLTEDGTAYAWRLAV